MHRTCRGCGEPFVPSPYQLKQKYCSKKDCQRERKSRYHRQRYRHDSAYREDCRHSRKKWRDQNLNYHRQYRNHHPEQVRQNREKQKPRDQLRRLRQQALQQKASLQLQPIPPLASSAKPDPSLSCPNPLERWAWIGLVPSGVKPPLDKNNLAPP